MADQDENEPGKKTVDPPKPPAPKARGSIPTWMKEATTTTIALAVTALTMWMLITTFNEASEDLKAEEAQLDKPELYQENEKLRLERKSSQKDVLLLTLALFGTVLGYYFGRIPAENRAERAEDTAEQAGATARSAVESAGRAQQQQMLEELARSDAEAQVEDALRTNQAVMALLEPDLKPLRATLSAGGQVAAGTATSIAAYEQLAGLKERLSRRRHP